MTEYIVLAVEALLLLLYPLSRTYKIWKSTKMEPRAYQETVTYWMIFAMLHGLGWLLNKEYYPYIRIAVLIVFMFTLHKIAPLLFRVQKDKAKKN
ncbi:hypothetical protein SteCoe_7635 [Stentor coeruleus]|uniref:Uncharacterized protein n=1 Tax=Stentor coeruleus TaxID=5963 RepID=A0A1R2CM17_9CILI|nr:hypothetical protein SteCoe_7635 [Stentor coeruleus]